MATYGSVAAIKALLRQSDGASMSGDEDDRIAELQEVISAIVEEMTGATFAAIAPSATTRAMDADGGVRLYLDTGLRTLSSVTESPEWSSGDWTGGMALTSDAYRLTSQVGSGAYRTIQRMDGFWLAGGTYLISGVWEDTIAPVPAEIDYVTNYLAAETFKKQQANPAGFVGPDGSVVPVRNMFRQPEVQQIIAKWTVGPGLWVM